MISVDDVVTNALAGSHKMIPRVTAMLNNAVMGTVEVTDGSVSYDERSSVPSRCDVTIGVPDLVSAGAFDPRSIDVSGWRLFIEYGVVIGQVVYYVPLGTFVCYDTRDSDTGELQVSGYDTTVLLRDGRFPAPYSIAAGTNYQTALTALCTAINLQSSFPVTAYTTPLLLFQEGDDRLQKMNDMAASLGGTIVADSFGLITLKANAATGSGTAIDFIEGAGCKMTNITKQRTRQQVYNIAVFTGEPAGSTAPVTGTAYDTDPNSSTYYLGPFGQVPVFEKSQFVTTTAQAQGAAQGLLNRKKGIGSTYVIDTWGNPTLRPGDPIGILRSRMGINQIVPIASLSISLVPGSGMSVTTREGTVA